MSGHSKWSTIKHGKAVTDARRGQLFTKLAKEIIAAARQGGGSAETNFRLRMAVQRAKDNNMPSNNIDRAIKRATGGNSEDDQMGEVVYEGYGPGGTAILVNTLTDNRNRTVSDVRSAFTKCGGGLAEAGAVAWQFEQKGVAVVHVDASDVEEMTLRVIDAGAIDVEVVESTIHVYSAPEMLETIRTELIEQGALVRSSELSMVPTNTVTLDNKTAKQTLRLLDDLEELDDTQKVFSNADFSDEILGQYGEEG